MTIPDDLTPDEAALVAAMRRPVDERAALAVRVRRAIRRHRARGRSLSVALDLVAADLPVSRSTAENIWYQLRAYALP